MKYTKYYTIITVKDRDYLYEVETLFRKEAVDYFNRLALRVGGEFDGNVYTYKN